MTTTKAAEAAVKRELHQPVTGCGGEGCEARHPWPLHHVRHRGVFCRLCTSCVLKYHPGSFCSLCFAVLDAGSAAAAPPASDRRAVVHCSKCPSVSHHACLPNPDLASQFVCPSCKNPEDFSYFPADGRRRPIDPNLARVLLAAARLSSSSMNRAAAVARAEAERKVKEAVIARKRAREMIERAITISAKEKEKMEESVEMASDVVMEPEVVETKKSVAAAMAAARVVNRTVDSSLIGQKRVQSREREKWMRLHEPISVAAAQAVAESEKYKGVSHFDTKSRVGSVNQLSNPLGREDKERKGPFLSPQSGYVKDEGMKTMVDADKGPRIPQPSQDALISRANPRAIFTASPSTASLHS